MPRIANMDQPLFHRSGGGPLGISGEGHLLRRCDLPDNTLTLGPQIDHIRLPAVQTSVAPCLMILLALGPEQGKLARAALLALAGGQDANHVQRIFASLLKQCFIERTAFGPF